MLGLCVGSFVATLVLRWIDGRSAMTGRSACDGCHRTLAARDLVPLVGWALGAGRCRHCGARIDPLHPLGEVAGAIIGVSALALMPGPAGIALALLGWQLLALALVDARALWLPDRLVLLLAVTGLALGGLATGASLSDRLIGGGAAFLALAAVAMIYRRWRGHEGMGGGDPKLFGAIGLWIGWQMLPPVLLLAALAGLAAALTRRRAADWRMQPIAFGTCLALAAGLVAMLMAGGWA